MRLFNESLKAICSKNVCNFPLQLIRCAHSAQKKLANGLFATQYCIDLVQKNDYENYLCTLLIKGSQRRHAFALRAFNVEVAKCDDKVTIEQTGKMRLKFWQDAIDKCYERKKTYVADHPVLRELKNTIETYKLNKVHLKRLVTSRDRPPNKQFLTMREMEDYAEQSFSSLLYLLIQLSGAKDMQIDHAVSHLGKAHGIVTLLRAIPYKGRGQSINIPQEVLIKHGVSQERVMRSSEGDTGVEECVFEVATVAHQHLGKARSLADKIPKDMTKLFLPAVAIERYLERLRKAKFRLTDQSCLQRDSMLPMALYWASFRGKY